MYELLVLSLLMHSPLHAYLIAKICNDILGPWEKISRGTLSTLILRLEKNGLIIEINPADVPFQKDRPSRTFAITASGREQFLHLMLDTTTTPGAYQKLFHIKSINMEFLSAQDQLYLVNHYLYYCQTAIRHLQKHLQEFAFNPDEQRYNSSQTNDNIIKLMNLHLEKWELEMVWGQALQERTLADLNRTADK